MVNKKVKPAEGQFYSDFKNKLKNGQIHLCGKVTKKKSQNLLVNFKFVVVEFQSLKRNKCDKKCVNYFILNNLVT